MVGPVVVMGVSGSGKSTVGRALAKELDVAFEEGDDLHPAANVAKMAAGLPLDDADRAPWLAEVARWLGGHPDGGVISCSALRRAYRDVLRRAAPGTFFVHLDGPPELLAARVSGRAGHFMPATLLGSQLATLEPLGADERGVVVPIGRPVAELVERATAAVRDAAG